MININMIISKMNKEEFDKLSWIIIEKYFKGRHLSRLVRHQIESYNYFVNYQIKNTIEMFNPVTIRSENDKDEKTGLYKLELI